jgi:hypothetical protein
MRISDASEVVDEVSRGARRAEKLILSLVVDPKAVATAVPELVLDLVGEEVQVYGDIGDPVTGQKIQRVSDERFGFNGKERLRAIPRELLESRATSCAQHECLQRHRRPRKRV